MYSTSESTAPTSETVETMEMFDLEKKIFEMDFGK